MRKVLGIVIAIAVVFGIRLWSKSNAESTVRQRLVEVCEGEAPCVAAVEKHFDACFEQSYSMSRRRSRLDNDKLVTCINDRSGAEWFSADEEE
jgi:hypothetical protein